MPSAVEEQTSLEAPRSTVPGAVLFDSARAFSRLEWIAITAITLAGAALRLHALGARSLWFDEGFGAGIALMSWRDFGFLCSGSTANMAIYYLLLKFWLALGHSDAWTRGLSLLFGVAGIPALFGLARRMGLLLRALEHNSERAWTAWAIVSAPIDWTNKADNPYDLCGDDEHGVQVG